MFGDGNDRFKLLKGQLSTAAPVDPVATDSFHVTIRHTDELGPTMLTIDLPPGAPWSGGLSFIYLDPLATLGMRKILLKSFGSDYIYKAIGKNVSINNTPVLTGDTIHLMIEFENGGAGYCFGGILHCTATGTGANCG